MKFLCIECDAQMTLEDRREPGDGTFAVGFVCPSCQRRVAMLANPMETGLVSSLGLKIGGEALEPQSTPLARDAMLARADAFGAVPAPAKRARPAWTPESEARLERTPKFVRSMVRKIYNDWASERGIVEITPAVMDEARSDLGLEGM